MSVLSFTAARISRRSWT